VGKNHCVMVEWDNPPIYCGREDWRSAHWFEVIEESSAK
jgi:hypothetical protein